MKKQLKKSLSLLLTLVMVLSLLPTMALAATAITPTTPAGSGTSADPYRIGTAEELYGFAKIVNDGDTDAHAILMADITVNENVLSYYALNGTEEDFVAWDPINRYEGIFDGRGHTISGLFISYTSSNRYDHCGFFEEVSGIVRDLTITDSYYRVSYGFNAADRNIGGICGKLGATGTVWQCHFDGVIDADQGDSAGSFKIGGIVGYNFSGVIKECSVSGRVDGKAGGSNSGVGGIVGVSSGGTVTRCCTNAPVTNVTAPSATKNGQASVGGIVGRVSYDGTVTDSYTGYNRGSIWGYGYVGGIVGSAESCDIQLCWTHSALINLNTVLDEPKTDTYVYMGGILGHAGGTLTSNVIKNCYNRGAIHPGWRAATSDIGPFIGAGIVGNYDGSMNASLSISYCHNMGNYYGEHPNNASDTYNPIVTEDKGTISNCYYKIDNNEVGERDEVANTVAYQLRDFENGTVVDLLNDQPLFDNQNYWEQGKESPELVARPEIVPTRLEILSHPTKTAYNAGEDFDPTGMVVQMHYSDGSVLPVVGYTVSGGECMLNTVKSVTIRYTDNGVTRQTDEPVTVTGDNPTYKVTVNLQGTGGGSYAVGSQVTIRARSVTGAQFVGWNGLADVKIIQGSVTSQSVTFIMPKKNVTATPIYGEVRNIEVTKEPKKTVYYEGEDFDPTGMVVTAYALTVPGGDKVSMPITNYTMTGNQNLQEGENTVTIKVSTGLKANPYVTTTLTITVLPVPTLTVTNGTGSGSYIPGTEVTVTANAADDQIFWSWQGLPEEIEIIEGSAFTPSMTFVMPKVDVKMEAVIETIELAKPQGNGTASNPFEISNMKELYWFQRFVNGALAAEDITVEPTAACAKVAKDITVNADLLNSEGVPAQTSGLAKWTPIAMGSSYTGTFDGQNHTISGIYYDPQSAVSSPYAGFFSSLGEGSGTICNLTLADSYFCAPIQMENAYTGGIVGQVPLGSTVENCHFNGTVTTGDSEGRDGMGGIAAVNRGVIRDCTTKGKVYGYGFNVGGIAGYAYRDIRENDEGGEVIGCVNEATVGTTMTLDDSLQFTSGGIVGSSSSGIIRDCCNKGDLTSIWVVGGIVGQLEGTNAAVIRCWNEGRIERGYGAGIVSKLGTYASIDNCYNAGVASYAGIAATFQQGHNTISNCHNVGEITRYAEYPICGVPSGSNITIENCYYLGTAETDAVVGTTYKTAAEFRNGTVLELLNSGDNAGNWKQDTQYPVLAELYTIVVDTINIKGITAPVAGEAPVITGITTDTAGITLKNVQWQNGSSVMNSTNKFEPGQTYNLWVRYEVADGYKVSDDVTVTSDLENSTDDIDTARRIVHIWYTVPAAPKYTVTVTGGGTVEGKASVTIEAGNRLQLRAPEVSGKRFTGWSGLDGVTFYGDNAKVTDPILGFIMPAKNFTVTANYQDAVEITNINIKGITKPLAGANPVNFGVTTDTIGLSVKEVIWYFDRTPSTNVPHDYEFQLDDKLYLLVFLDVADGYTFADPVTITADLEYTAAYRGLTYGTVYLEYTVTEELPTATTYTVTVNNGTGSGDYAEGASVTITANAPDTGKQFKEWTTEDGVIFADATASTTTFTMPAKPVTITAVFEDIAYSVTVEGGTLADGTTSGSFKVYEKVVIIPNDPPAGKMFSKWEATPAAAIRESSDGTYYFSMPDWAVTVTAVYVDAALSMDAWLDYTEVSGGYSEVVNVQVEYLDTVEGLDPTVGAMLIVARYSCNEDDYGKMTDVSICSVQEDGTYALPALFCGEEEYYEYRVFLVDGKTWEPLYDWMAAGA